MVFLKNDDLKKCAEVALLAYAYGKSGIDKTKVERWMEDIEFLGNDDKVVYCKNSVKPPDSQKIASLYFGFRGTDISHLSDLCDNLNILKSILSDVTCDNDGGKFHKGFKNRSKVCLQQVLDKLDQSTKDLDELETYQIFFCGHSLGGVTAAVSSIRLKTKKSKLKKMETVVDPDSIMEIEGQDEVDLKINLTPQQQKIVLNLPYEVICVTFGAPSFGSKANQAYCNEKKFSNLIYNVIHINDPVPKILYKVPDQWKPCFVINAKTAIGSFKIFFDGADSKEYDSENFEKVEEYIKDKNHNSSLEHHRLRNYLQLFSEQNYGSTALDIITRTNNDMKAMKQCYYATDIIGQGAFGVVMKGVNKKDNTEVAIKKIKTNVTSDKTINLQQINNSGTIIECDPEIATLTKIKHENVVKMYGFCTYDGSKIYLALELCIMDLHRYIKELEGNLDENKLSTILKDCLLGLKALHDANIIHRDVKPSNVLLAKRTENGDDIFKIGDLGSTSQRGEKTNTMTVRGSKLYASPEINLALSKDHGNVKLNPQTDIFSIAASMLYCGKKDHPWTENDLKLIDDELIERFVNEIFPNESDFKFMFMLKKMLKVDYKIRPEASELLAKYLQ